MELIIKTPPAQNLTLLCLDNSYNPIVRLPIQCETDIIGITPP